MPIGSKLRISLAVLALAVAPALTSHAIPLSDLINGDTIEVGDKLFANFAVTRDDSQDDNGDIDVDYSGIDVTSISPSALVHGLKFTATSLSASGFGLIDFDYEFTIAQTAGLSLIKDNELELISFTGGPNHYVQVTEQAFDIAGALGQLADKDVHSIIEEGQADDVVLIHHVDFANTSALLVQSNVTIFPDSNDGTAASLTMWSQTFSQDPIPGPPPPPPPPPPGPGIVPEPGTAILGLFGLGALVLRRRK